MIPSVQVSPAPRRRVALALAAAAALVAMGCATPPPTAPAVAPATPPTVSVAPPPAAAPAPAPAAPVVAAAPAKPPPPPAAPPPPVLPFDDAVLSAATALLTSAQLPPTDATDGRYPLVIDPLIDGVTGQQTVTTRAMGAKLTDLIKQKYPRYDVQRFTGSTIAKSPLVLIGTFTGVNAARQTTGPREAYRICLALADLKTGKLVSKGLAFSQRQGVDPMPLPYFRDSPAWTNDPATLGYVRTCQGTKAGDPINPAYLDRILAATMISDAIDAYGQGRYRESLGLFEAALRTPEGKQLRVYNGLYLANWKLGRRDAAAQAFGELVDFSVDNQRMATKFLFSPGSTAFYSDPNVTGAYPIWIREIATRVAKRNVCLEITGHTSPTGPEPLNERLSLLRAEYIRTRLQAQDATLAKKTIANGAGSRETMVGTGRDDATDSLDRRVEFKVIAC